MTSRTMAIGVGVASLLALVTVLVPTPAVGDTPVDEPAVTNLVVDASREAVTLSFTFQGGFPADVAETVSKGVPVSVTYDMEVVLERWWWWDTFPVSTQMTRRLTLDTVKGAYVVDHGEALDAYTDEDLAAAVADLVTVKEFRAPLDDPLGPGEYLVKVRATLEASTPKDSFLFFGSNGPEVHTDWTRTHLTVPKEGLAREVVPAGS